MTEDSNNHVYLSPTLVSLPLIPPITYFPAVIVTLASRKHLQGKMSIIYARKGTACFKPCILAFLCFGVATKHIGLEM